jgi:hypothetical protein
MKLHYLALLIVGLILANYQALAQEHTEVPEETRQLLHDVRATTVQFHDLDIALEGGYGKFLDCFKHGEEMGMGQHYVNGDLVGDDVLDPLQPEALVYETLSDGTMTLVAFEYLVFADVWDPNNTGREAPTLFGQPLNLKTNIPETPPVWALHVWLWSHNPEGLFADYNPIIFCPEDEPSVDMSMQ